MPQKRVSTSYPTQGGKLFSSHVSINDLSQLSSFFSIFNICYFLHKYMYVVISKKNEVCRLAQKYLEQHESRVSKTHLYKEELKKKWRSFCRWADNVKIYLIPWEAKIKRIESIFFRAIFPWAELPSRGTGLQSKTVWILKRSCAVFFKAPSVWVQ